MSQTQDWIKEKFKEERILGVNTEYTNMRLTSEIEQLKDRIKRLETDMAYTYKDEPGA
jgi:3-phenylpropionate/cinnamic acid dioxygenase small subunit